ncbi:MAG: low specificity L-threonine aldolase, partial [Acidobacteria bacterium]|nr:low specificity L-threonine aldolase [Acidobacteriota bacterium]
VLAGGPDTVRAVMHLDVSREQVDEAVAAFRRVAAG